jgi:hypothetical protein
MRAIAAALIAAIACVRRAGGRRRAKGRRAWSRVGGPGRTAGTIGTGIDSVCADSVGLARPQASVEAVAGIVLHRWTSSASAASCSSSAGTGRLSPVHSPEYH